jgi:hypothetical protein
MLPPVIAVLLTCVTTLFRARATLYLENLALWHQLAVYQQSVRRPRLRPTDRLFWVCLSRLWAGWQGALAFVQPRTVSASGSNRRDEVSPSLARSCRSPDQALG